MTDKATIDLITCRVETHRQLVDMGQLSKSQECDDAETLLAIVKERDALLDECDSYVRQVLPEVAMVSSSAKKYKKIRKELLTKIQNKDKP